MSNLLEKLTQIRVVLVETTHPGNIGATARAMKNMGLSRLVLVQPHYFPHADATARASGADDILHQASVVESLPEALAGCRLVLATSARRRELSNTILEARHAAQRAIAHAEQGDDVAIIFGQERSGLSNEQLGLSHYQILIPCNPEFSSLNLGAAVQLMMYECRMAALADANEVELPAEPLATAEEMEHFYRHLEQVMIESGFLKPDNPRQLMRRLRRLFNRAQVESLEVNILRGILKSVEKESV